jgi:amino acid transporter
VKLARDAVGLPELLFQSIACMAPAGAIAFSIPLGAPYAGGALPLSVLLALVPCAFCAAAMGQLAKHIHSAGALSTFVSRGLHPSAGFLVAWTYAFVWPVATPAAHLLLGSMLANTFHQAFGSSESLWWIWTLIGAAGVAAVGHLRIQASGRTTLLLGLFEIAVFLCLAATLALGAGHDNTVSVFTPDAANGDGFRGWSGVVAGSVYGILAFGGFEAAAPLAEEARAPSRTLPLAVVGAAIGIGVVYVATTYAGAVFFGPAAMPRFFVGGNPWQDMARRVWGPGWIVVLFAVVNSQLAVAVAANNAVTRTWYALARSGAFPSVLGLLHPRHRSPYVANAAQLVIAVVVGLPLGSVYGPIEAASLLLNVYALLVMAVYIAVNLSCLVYYARFRRSEFSLLLHGVAPVIGALAFVPPLLTSAGVRAFAFVTPLEPPASYAAPIAAIWLLLGVLYLLRLRSGRPEVIAAQL